jgi:hypothetical protein
MDYAFFLPCLLFLKIKIQPLIKSDKDKLFNIVEIFLCDYHQETFSTSEKIKSSINKNYCLCFREFVLYSIKLIF